MNASSDAKLADMHKGAEETSDLAPQQKCSRMEIQLPADLLAQAPLLQHDAPKCLRFELDQHIKVATPDPDDISVLHTKALLYLPAKPVCRPQATA